MASLGDFGTPREAHVDSFGYFGDTIQVHPDLSDLSLIDFAFMGEGLGEESSGSDAIKAVMVMLRSLVAVEDFDRFWSLAKQNRQTIEDLTALAESLIVAVTQRPTERPSSSSAGQPSTEANSEVDSFSPVVSRLVDKGRPDLALMVARSEEFMASA